MNPTERLRTLAKWFEHNHDEMKKNHRLDYNEFLNQLNRMWVRAVDLDEMHKKGER